VPCSVCATRIVTVSSGAIVSHALISGTIASRYQGWPWTAAAVSGARRLRQMEAEHHGAAGPRPWRREKSRRLMSEARGFDSRGHNRSSPQALQLGGPVDRRPDARIGPAATDVGHLAVDVGVGRLRLVP